MVLDQKLTHKILIFLSVTVANWAKEEEVLLMSKYKQTAFETLMLKCMYDINLIILNTLPFPTRAWVKLWPVSPPFKTTGETTIQNIQEKDSNLVSNKSMSVKFTQRVRKLTFAVLAYRLREKPFIRKKLFKLDADLWFSECTVYYLLFYYYYYFFNGGEWLLNSLL